MTLFCVLAVVSVDAHARTLHSHRTSSTPMVQSRGGTQSRLSRHCSRHLTTSERRRVCPGDSKTSRAVADAETVSPAILSLPAVCSSPKPTRGQPTHHSELTNTTDAASQLSAPAGGPLTKRDAIDGPCPFTPSPYLSRAASALYYHNPALRRRALNPRARATSTFPLIPTATGAVTSRHTRPLIG